MGADTQIIAREAYKVFFDGVCNLCNASVQFIIDRDRKKKFRFASLQSDFARDELRNAGIDADQLTSIVLKKGDRIYHKSTAVLKIARHLSGAWPLLYAFIIIPAPIRDFVYGIIAGNRYRWFGKQATCRVPAPELKERFLDS